MFCKIRRANLDVDQVISGNCDVDGYQARLPGLFYELLYNVTAFVGYEGQYIISTGDPTGKSRRSEELKAKTLIFS